MKGKNMNILICCFAVTENNANKQKLHFPMILQTLNDAMWPTSFVLYFSP